MNDTQILKEIAQLHGWKAVEMPDEEGSYCLTNGKIAGKIYGYEANAWQHIDELGVPNWLNNDGAALDLIDEVKIDFNAVVITQGWDGNIRVTASRRKRTKGVPRWVGVSAENRRRAMCLFYLATKGIDINEV